MSERSERIEKAATSAERELHDWLRYLPRNYVGKPLTQSDVSLVAIAANNLRDALKDRRKHA
jgi:hypothetical protein